MEHFVPEFEEDIATSFARLLTLLAHEHGAPLFAADLAEMGCRPQKLRLMAERWVEGDFSPVDAADLMRDFADAVQDLTVNNYAT